MPFLPFFFNDPAEPPFFDDNPDGNRPIAGGIARPPRLHSQGAKLGSGVIVTADGYILTANHVVQGRTRSKSRSRRATRNIRHGSGYGSATDVAVLRISAKDLPAMAIADSDKLEVGDVVLAIGNPFGVARP